MLSLVEITAFKLESKLPPMRALEFIRDHVTFKLPYDFSLQMKTPLDPNDNKCFFPWLYKITCEAIFILPYEMSELPQ